MKKRSAKQRKKPKPTGLIAPAKLPTRRNPMGPIIPAWMLWVKQQGHDATDPVDVKNSDPTATKDVAAPTGSKRQIPPGFDVMEVPSHV